MQVIFLGKCRLADYAGNIIFWKCRLADYAGKIIFWNCRLADYASKIYFYSFPNSFLCPPPIHKFILFFFYASERETEALVGGLGYRGLQPTKRTVILVGHFGWSIATFWLVDASFG